MAKNTAAAEAKSAPQKKAAAPRKIKAAGKAAPDACAENAREILVTGNAGVFGLWLAAWKKTLILRGRASRFELWSFLLINTALCVIIELLCSYVLSPHFLRTANDMGYGLDMMDGFITGAEAVFYLTIFLPLFPLGALLIRRMHDLNRLAWRGYLEPVFMGVVVLSMINIAITSLENTDLAYTTLLLSACFITILYSVGFYSLKFLIMTLFYRGDTGRNSYGDAKYNDEAHEERALNFSCWYFLFVLTVGLFYLMLALI